MGEYATTRVPIEIPYKGRKKGHWKHDTRMEEKESIQWRYYVSSSFAALGQTLSSAGEYNGELMVATTREDNDLRPKPKSKNNYYVIKSSREQHHIHRESPRGASGQSRNVTIYSRRPVHPSDSPC